MTSQLQHCNPVEIFSFDHNSENHEPNQFKVSGMKLLFNSSQNTMDNRIYEMQNKKHQTLILPEKSHFIRNKFRSDLHFNFLN